MGAGPAEAIRRRLAAILSTDAVGYSRLMARDDLGTLRLLEGHRNAIAGAVSRHGGRVVDCAGDNLLAELPSVMDAVLCAQEVQSVLEARNAELSPQRRLRFRIGIHLGDVLVNGDRIAGDGVNIAARIEALAAPGGLAISGAAFDQIRGKLDLQIEDLGPRDLKNIANPVRVLRTSGGEHSALPNVSATSVPGFAGRPAIAVLPFDNMSGDPDQEYFADGLAEELITRLAECRLLPVIARNSTFAFKGQATDVKRVSEELGARYVVEGAVRLSGSRLRVTAQLIDATIGHHIWADRYERELDDVFRLQDEITEMIVGAMHPGLLDSEQQRAQASPIRLDAWDTWLRGLAFYHRHSRSDNRRARKLFRAAGRLDPGAAAYPSWVAMTHWFDLALQWSSSPERSVRHLMEAAQRAMSLDANDTYSQLSLAFAEASQGRSAEALEACRAALATNPSFAYSYIHSAGLLALSGRADEAIALGEKALRLSPYDPQAFLVYMFIGMAHFAAGRYDEAEVWGARSRRHNAEFAAGARLLATVYAHWGRTEEARAAWAEAHRLAPDFSPQHFQMLHRHAEPELIKRYIEGLRMAGMEE